MPTPALFEDPIGHGDHKKDNFKTLFFLSRSDPRRPEMFCRNKQPV